MYVYLLVALWEGGVGEVLGVYATQEAAEVAGRATVARNEPYDYLVQREFVQG